MCLFDVIGEVGERVATYEDDADDVDDEDGDEGARPSTRSGSKDNNNGVPDLPSPPAWAFSDVVTEKKSVFVARAARVKSREQAEKYLDYLLATEKKVASATHNITAWRIREKITPTPTPTSTNANSTTTSDVRIYQDFDDDGETAAGGRMLHLMQLMDVWDVVVVVTRWYGGVKLGPDRFRIINGVARDALVKGGFERSGGEGAAGQEKGRKKGKK